MKTEPGIAVMWLQTKECWQPPRGGREKGGCSLRAPRGSVAPPSSRFWSSETNADLWPPELVRLGLCCCKPPRLW